MVNYHQSFAVLFQIIHLSGLSGIVIQQGSKLDAVKDRYGCISPRKPHWALGCLSGFLPVIRVENG
jgi:hypothetical protein